MAFSRRNVGISGFRGVRGLGAFSPADVKTRLLPWANGPATDSGNVQLSGNGTAPPSTSPVTNWRDMVSQAAMAETLFKSYGGKALSNPLASTYDIGPPWIDPPAGHRDINNPGIIATPNNSGTDVVVQTYIFPPGWDGVITEIANFYTGPGFLLGSGYLIWRILRNGQAIKNFDSIQVAFGTYTQGGGLQTHKLAAGIRGFSGDVVQYVVNHSTASTLPIGGTNIITFLKGWLYPKGN